MRKLLGALLLAIVSLNLFAQIRQTPSPPTLTYRASNANQLNMIVTQAGTLLTPSNSLTISAELRSSDVGPIMYTIPMAKGDTISGTIRGTLPNLVPGLYYLGLYIKYATEPIFRVGVARIEVIPTGDLRAITDVTGLNVQISQNTQILNAKLDATPTAAITSFYAQQSRADRLHIDSVKVDVSGSTSAAAASAASAEAYKNAASTSAGFSSASATSAATNAALAQTYSSNANTSATNAAISAGQASASATSAQASATSAANSFTQTQALLPTKVDVTTFNSATLAQAGTDGTQNTRLTALESSTTAPGLSLSVAANSRELAAKKTYISLKNYHNTLDKGSAKIAFVGDSKTAQLASPLTNLFLLHSKPGGLLEGVSYQNFGSTGQKAENFMTDGVNGFSAVVGYAPDLIRFDYGTNDVGLNGWTATQLFNIIKPCIDALRSALPNTDILLVTPQAWLTTNNVGGSVTYPETGILAGLTTTQKAQAMSDVVYQAYLMFDGLYNNVIVHDTRKTLLFNTTKATSVLYGDNIHLATAANGLMLEEEVQQFFGRKSKPAINGYEVAQWGARGGPLTLNMGQMADAVNSVGYRLAPTAYPGTVLSPDYELIFAGRSNGTTAGQANVDLTGQYNFTNGYTNDSWGKKNAVRPDDILVLMTNTGPVAYTCPTSVTSDDLSNAHTTMRLNGLSSLTIAATDAGSWAGLFRNKFQNSPVARAYAQLKAVYPASAVFRVVSSTNGSLVYRQENDAPNDASWTFQSGDVIVLPDVGAITCTTAVSQSISYGGSLMQLQVNQSGTDFTTTSPSFMVFGQGQSRKESMKPVPFRLDLDGALSSATYYRSLTRTSRFNNISAYLETAGSSTTTVTVRTIQTSGDILMLTLTFASGSTTPTVTYANPSAGVVAVPGIPLRVIVSAGTGAAGLHINMDTTN